MRTLNWRKTLGYNLVMAELRTADFSEPGATGFFWLASIAEVAYVEFGETFPQYIPAPHLRMADRTTLTGFATEILTGLIDTYRIRYQDLYDAAYVTVRYLNMRDHYMEGSR